MAIPDTIIHYLEDKGVTYEVVSHPHTGSSWQTAIAAKVDPGSLAKAILLADEEGLFLAVLPASRDLDMHALEARFGRRPEMVAEHELPRHFPDCTLGAVPAIGGAYRLDMVVDEALEDLPEVWFEAGDHEDVIRLKGSDFLRLAGDALFARISREQDT